MSFYFGKSFHICYSHSRSKIGGAAKRAAFKGNIDLDRRVATAIKDFTATDLSDLRHADSGDKKDKKEFLV